MHGHLWGACHCSRGDYRGTLFAVICGVGIVVASASLALYRREQRKFEQRLLARAMAAGVRQPCSEAGVGLGIRFTPAGRLVKVLGFALLLSGFALEVLRRLHFV